MLVLRRKRGETVRIGHDVEVTVLAIHGSSVRLGFRGPPDVPIHREEVRLKIERNPPAFESAQCV